jgi:selenocysteine lyase/cysteine desulfurase
MIMSKEYCIVSNLFPENMSGILTFRGRNIIDKYNELIQRGIIVSLRNRWIRTSAHLYNNRDDIDQLLDVL